METSFGEWLKQRRKGLDLTREELAQQVGCSAATIRKLEANERRPSKEIAALLALCLAIPADQHAAFLVFARSGHAPSQFAVAQVTPPMIATVAPAVALALPRVPQPPTRLIGRTSETAMLLAYVLNPSIRLITLVGPAGVGKTRLSQELGVKVGHYFADGVGFVPLAATEDPALVLDAIATALTPPGRREFLQGSQLSTVLHTKQLLLILDNFEHVIGAAPTIATLLSQCPHLKLLVTSRTPLQIRAEQQVPITPLELPDVTALPQLALLQHNPAVALFVERVQAILPGFQLTAANSAATAAICARLDGLPLALELVAARCKVLTPADLVARLGPPEDGTSLHLLTQGATDVPQRHQTLRAALAWSYGLLAPAEQRLLARLGVFVGGWTLAGAEVVAGDDQVPAVVNGLQTLLDNSLIRLVSSEGQDRRFAMLETIRDFALERLAATNEATLMRQRHAGLYCTLAETAAPHFTTDAQRHWLDVLETEHANLRAALHWTLQHGPAEILGRLGAALWRFWWLRSHLSEGRRWMEHIVEHQAELPPEIAAKVLNGAGALAFYQGAYATAQELYTEALTVRRALGDQAGIAASLGNLGNLMRQMRDLPAAQRMYNEGLAIFRTLGQPWGIATSLLNLGTIAEEQADYATAHAFYRESLAIYTAQGDQHGMALAEGNLGSIALLQQQYPLATEHYQNCLRLRLAIGNQAGMAGNLEALVYLAVSLGDLGRAARLCGAAMSLRQRLGTPLEASHAQLFTSAVTALQQQLDPTAYTAAWNEGAQLSLEQVISLVLDAPPIAR